MLRKFMDNTRYAMKSTRAAAIIEMILNVESVPNMRTLAGALGACE